MASTDFSEFAEEGFDPVAWINATCAAKPGEEQMEKFLAELEMRLQLTAEEIEASLQDYSAQAMRRIPFAIQEIYRLQGDVQGLQDQVRVLSAGVSRDASEAQQAVSALSALDCAKVNMESAYASLREATELSSSFIKVEEVFAAGDLPKVAEMLSSMRRSLNLVGDVPEFRAGRQRLSALEDRLQNQVEGTLAEALSKGGSDEQVVALCGLLLAVGRYSTIEQLYCNTKLAQIHQLWEQSSSAAIAAAAAATMPGQTSTPPSSSSSSSSAAAAAASGSAAVSGAASDPLVWIPKFLARLQGALEGEARWCGRVLPSHAAQLLAALAGVVMSKVSKGVRERLAPVKAVAQLAAFGRDLAAFGRAVWEMLAGADPAARTAVMHQVYSPLEEKVAEYGPLESSHLSKQLQVMFETAPRNVSSGMEDVDTTVARLAAAVKPAVPLMQASLERCLSLTGGTELRALVKAVDDTWAAHLGRMQSVILAIRDRYAPPGFIKPTPPHPQSAAAAAPTPAAEVDADTIAQVLKLLRVSRDITASSTQLDAALRTTIATTVPKLQAAVEKATSATAATAAGASTSTSAAAPSNANAMATAATATTSTATSSGAALMADPVVLRLMSSSSAGSGRGGSGLSGADRLARLGKLAASLSDARFQVLPSTSTALEAITQAIQSTVSDVLLARVAVLLRPLPDMDEWRRDTAPTVGLGGGVMPSFNAYPLQYVTLVADYLMTMPQQLEVLVGAEGSGVAGGAAAGGEGGGVDAAAAASAADEEAEMEEMAAEWLDKIITAAAYLYTDYIARVPQLGAQGGQQLAADVEYFANVMGALHVSPPPPLLTYQLFAGLAPEGWGDAVRAAVAEGSADAATARALAAMRRLPPLDF